MNKWQGALDRAAAEFAPTALEIVTGEIPTGLRGTLYRNGPGRFDRGGKRVDHWFDGDGAIIKVTFTDGGAVGVYRYVQTAGYQAEAAADRLLYAGYGTLGSKNPWQPELGTEIIIIDRDSLELVSRNTVEPWFQWHFCNGYVDNHGLIILDLIGYQDFTTDRFLSELSTGKIETNVYGTLWQITVDPQSGKLIDRVEVCPRGCELPEIDNRQTGKQWRYTYVNCHRTDIAPTGEILATIGRFDRVNANFTTAELAPHLYASTPIFASDLFTNNGWVLTIIYDSNRHCSQLWIYHSDRLNESPACILQLPSIVPMGFHGTFRIEN